MEVINPSIIRQNYNILLFLPRKVVTLNQNIHKSINNMKPILFAAITACLLTACHREESPKDVIVQYATAIQANDYQKALEYTALPDGEKEAVLSLLEDYAPDNELTIASFEVTDEHIDPKEGTAEVNLTIHYATGKTETQRIPMIKNDEGEWLVKEIF